MGFSFLGPVSTQSPNRDSKTTYESSPISSLSWAAQESPLLRASSLQLPNRQWCKEEKMVVTTELFRKGQLVNPSHLSLDPAGLDSVNNTALFEGGFHKCSGTIQVGLLIACLSVCCSLD